MQRWLTYRYRLGGGVTDATGTIKAPSFEDAARSLVRDRLGAHLGRGPAYLRLRAAGQEEVLFQVAAPDGGEPRLAVVPPGTFAFAGAGADDAAGEGAAE